MTTYFLDVTIDTNHQKLVFHEVQLFECDYRYKSITSFHEVPLFECHYRYKI